MFTAYMLTPTFNQKPKKNYRNTVAIGSEAEVQLAE